MKVWKGYRNLRSVDRGRFSEGLVRFFFFIFVHFFSMLVYIVFIFVWRFVFLVVIFGFECCNFGERIRFLL